METPPVRAPDYRQYGAVSRDVVPPARVLGRLDFAKLCAAQFLLCSLRAGTRARASVTALSGRPRLHLSSSEASSDVMTAEQATSTFVLKSRPERGAVRLRQVGATATAALEARNVGEIDSMISDSVVGRLAPDVAHEHPQVGGHRS